MSDQLMLHQGGREVDRAAIATVEAPPGTDTWYPIPHATVLESVEETLDNTGFVIEQSWLSLSRNDMRFFGVLDLTSGICDGVSLSIGIRNSNDKSFPLGFCCGTRTFVCDNLAFSAEIVIAKRHTRFGEGRYREGIANAVSSLSQFQAQEAEKIGNLQRIELPDDRANSIMLQSYEAGIVRARALPELIHEWREPRHEEFRPRTAYSMLQAFAEVLKPRFERFPQRAAHETMRFQRLLLN